MKECCREVLWRSVKEECFREALENIIVEKCWRRVLERSVVEKCVFFSRPFSKAERTAPATSLNFRAVSSRRTRLVIHHHISVK